MADDRYDIVIFGASGFTGIYVIEQLIRYENRKQRKLRWAVAGRDEKKLRNALLDGAERAEVAHFEPQSVPVILADVADQQSLTSMTKQTNILLNVVGPYRFYGETVVKTCIETGTHVLDISGEPKYLDNVHLNYHDKAREKGVYVVGACGFDSIPADIGVEMTRKMFDGVLESIESFIQLDLKARASGNSTTWDCIVEGLGDMKTLGPARRALYPRLFGDEKVFKNKYPATPRTLFKHPDSIGWCLTFLGSDKSVVKRTQLNNYQLRKQRPIDYQPYIVIPNFLTVLVLGVVGIFLKLLTPFEWGRKMLKEHVKYFTFGFFRKGGDSYQRTRRTKLEIRFKGLGWKGLKNDDILVQPNEPPKDVIETVFKLQDPGYTGTSIMFFQSALTILDEKDRLPAGGGVYTPASAFMDSTLVERLAENNITITCVNQEQ